MSVISTPPEIRGRLTEIVHREQTGGFSSFCPELPVASQGETEQEASQMLAEAVACFFEGNGSPAWNADEERKDIARWCKEYDMVCVYEGSLRH